MGEMYACSLSICSALLPTAVLVVEPSCLFVSVLRAHPTCAIWSVRDLARHCPPVHIGDSLEPYGLVHVLSPFLGNIQCILPVTATQVFVNTVLQQQLHNRGMPIA
jgi:hypothetical protein